MKKNLYIPFIIGLFMLLSITSVSAGIEVNLSVDNPLIAGSYMNVSANSTASSDAGNFSCAFQARSASISTNNATFTTIANITNSTNLRRVNITIPSTLVYEDANDYQFRAMCQLNVSGSFAAADNFTGYSAVISSRTMDLSNPVAPTGITFSNPVGDGGTITATINRINANRCWIKFGSADAPSNAMTLSGNTCTFTVTQNNPPDSAYSAFLSADDRTDAQVNSAVQNIEIDAVKSDGGGLFGGGAQISVPANNNVASALGTSSNPFAPKNDKNTTLIIVLVILGVYLYNKKR